MKSEELIKLLFSSNNILFTICGIAIFIIGVYFILKTGLGFLKSIFAGDGESNIEIGNLLKFSRKGKKEEYSDKKEEKGSDKIESDKVKQIGGLIEISKNSIISCLTQTVDEVINYHTETSEIKNQLLKSQLATTKRILNPISFTFTQKYKTDLEKKNKDNPSFDIRYDDSSWFFGKLVELDFETIIMKELDEAYSRNHLVEKNEEEFQSYSNTIARRCVKAFEASIDNYRKPVDLIIARNTYEDNKDELFKQINACIDDAKRQCEENRDQIINRNIECNKKLSQILTINIPELKASDFGQIVKE